jgi:hypothetical protein
MLFFSEGFTSISCRTRSPNKVAGYSVADEIKKLDRLKKSAAIIDLEFARVRAKLVNYLARPTATAPNRFKDSWRD